MKIEYASVRELRPHPNNAPDLKAALERALDEPIKLKQGERERTMTMAEAGIKQLVAQFVKGNIS
jgi:hypothetical protein